MPHPVHPLGTAHALAWPGGILLPWLLMVSWGLSKASSALDTSHQPCIPQVREGGWSWQTTGRQRVEMPTVFAQHVAVWFRSGSWIAEPPAQLHRCNSWAQLKQTADGFAFQPYHISSSYGRILPTWGSPPHWALWAPVGTNPQDLAVQGAGGAMSVTADVRTVTHGSQVLVTGDKDMLHKLHRLATGH